MLTILMTIDVRMTFFVADVSRIFGPEVLNKARCLCEGRVDWLAHMPLPILLYIISFLDIVDVANLSQVNSFFR